MQAGSSSGPMPLNSAQIPSMNLRPKRSASRPIGICNTTLPAMNTVTRSSAARSPMPACKPNSGSSARSADSTNPATSGREHDHGSGAHGAHQAAQRRELLGRASDSAQYRERQQRQHQTQGTDDERARTSRPGEFQKDRVRR